MMLYIPILLVRSIYPLNFYENSILYTTRCLQANITSQNKVIISTLTV